MSLVRTTLCWFDFDKSGIANPSLVTVMRYGGPVILANSTVASRASFLSLSDSQSSWAVLASAFAASKVTNETSSSLFALNWVVAERIWLFKDDNDKLVQASPATPNITMNVANASNKYLRSSGCSGALTIPVRHKRFSSLYSKRSPTTSNTTPMRTRTAARIAICSGSEDDTSRELMDLSKAEMPLSKVEMEASIREESIGATEGQLAKCWGITAIANLSLGVVAIAVPAIYWINDGDATQS